MGTLARTDMYPGGTYHGFFKHLENLLKEVVTDGIRTSARALAAPYISRALSVVLMRPKEPTRR
eukprot:5225312-Prymnesium_polylepis.1